MASHPIYQFYAELDDYKPKIWRRFQVTNNITAARLGYIIQVLFEMTASHLFCIEHDRPFLTPSGRPSKRMELICRYEVPDEESCWMDVDVRDATKVKINQLNLYSPSRLTVWYDFGDDWRVSLTLEKILEDKALSGIELPRALEGEGFGIIEDVGGTWGLADLADAFKKKKGEDYKRFSEWLGVDDLDMEAFDLDDMNFRLKKIPRIYKQCYEDKLQPTQRSINLIERKYLRTQI